MILETILGSVVGGAFRLAPEVLKWLDRKGERSHELAMQDKQLAFEKQRFENEVLIEQEKTYGLGLEALDSAIKSQGKRSGVSWIDALSASVRPVVTYWFMAMYCAVKSFGIYATYQLGGDMGQALMVNWTEADMALFAGIINFWFLGRVFERGQKRA